MDYEGRFSLENYVEEWARHRDAVVVEGTCQEDGDYYVIDRNPEQPGELLRVRREDVLKLSLNNKTRENHVIKTIIIRKHACIESFSMTSAKILERGATRSLIANTAQRNRVLYSGVVVEHRESFSNFLKKCATLRPDGSGLSADRPDSTSDILQFKSGDIVETFPAGPFFGWSLSTGNGKLRHIHFLGIRDNSLGGAGKGIVVRSRDNRFPMRISVQVQALDKFQCSTLQNGSYVLNVEFEVGFFGAGASARPQIMWNELNAGVTENGDRLLHLGDPTSWGGGKVRYSQPFDGASVRSKTNYIKSGIHIHSGLGGMCQFISCSWSFSKA